MTNNESSGTASLWDEDLSKARSGLEEQVLSLTKLAEGIVAEADTKARELQVQAINDAKTEAQTIIKQAQEQARNLIEKKEQEALALVQSKVEMIQASSEKLQQTYIKLKSQLQNLQQQLTIFEVDIDHTISTINGKEDPKKIVNEVTKTENTDLEKHNISSSQINNKRSVANIEKAKKASSSIKLKESTYYEQGIELEVIPPISQVKIKEIIKYLENLNEVENVQYIPIDNKPIISLYLSESLPLIGMLKKLPQISRAWEVKDKSKAIIGAGYSKGKVRRIQLSLWL